jgi:hypothetical protein
LTTHFEDAVADLVQQGIPQTTAIERALAAMGDPQPVMCGFNDVHRGQHHYKAGMVASLMLMLVIFGFHQLHAALGLTEYSTLSRLFYIFYHSLNTALVCYIVVIAARRLLMWRFGILTIDLPCKIVLGGSALYLVGNTFLELTTNSWNPVPTALNAANVVDGVGLLIMHGGMVITGAGSFLLGARIVGVRNALVKSIAVLALIKGVALVLALVLWYLDVGIYNLFDALLLLTDLMLWPLLSLLFFQAAYARYRPPPVAA